MHLTLPAGDLADLLGRIRAAVPARTTIPILGHVLLDAGGGRLDARGTSLEIELSASASAEIAVPGRAAVPADILAGIASRLPKAAPVTLALKEGALEITSGRSKYKVRTLDPAEFPEAKTVKSATTFRMSGDDLDALLAGPRIAMSTAETRFYLNGIFLHIGTPPVDGLGRMLMAVSTDGHRLVATWTPVPAGAEGLEAVIVPRHAIPLIIGLADDAGAGEVIVELTPSRIAVAAGSARLVSQLVDGTFPDWRRVVPSAAGGRGVTVAPDEIAEAIRRLEGASRGEKVTRIGLHAGAGELRLEARSTEGTSEGEETIGAEVEHEGAEVGFNGKYMIELMESWPGDAPVRVEIADAGSPMRLSRDDVAMVQVLMPMRL